MTEGVMSSSAEIIVQAQLDAYNARDIAALMRTYADDAQVFEHPNTLLADGADAIRARQVERFNEPNLHAALQKRIVAGATVIDHELIRRTFPEGPGTLELVAIYRVENDRIKAAWFISGKKTLEAR